MKAMAFLSFKKKKWGWPFVITFTCVECLGLVFFEVLEAENYWWWSRFWIQSDCVPLVNRLTLESPRVTNSCLRLFTFLHVLSVFIIAWDFGQFLQTSGYIDCCADSGFRGSLSQHAAWSIYQFAQVPRKILNTTVNYYRRELFHRTKYITIHRFS